jgi:hypothetical protein
MSFQAAKKDYIRMGVTFREDVSIFVYGTIGKETRADKAGLEWSEEENWKRERATCRFID